MELIFGTIGSGTWWALARSYGFWLELKDPWLELTVGTLWLMAGARWALSGIYGFWLELEDPWLKLGVAGTRGFVASTEEVMDGTRWAKAGIRGFFCEWEVLVDTNWDMAGTKVTVAETWWAGKTVWV